MRSVVRAFVLRSVLASAASALALGALEAEALACGGCFHPPDPERPTVVTDHRMVLSVGRGKSTLYDQIRYTGNPREFAWVLPIAGDVEVGISSDELFAGLDAFSQTEIVSPPRNCPPQPEGCESASCGASRDSLSFSESAGDPSNPGVVVTREEVVGPYATVQLQSTDPQALTKWLNDNGFKLGEAERPIVEQYVKESFNFLALKLRPGASVQAMRPIRVTSVGPSIVLPLRMVAAGAGASLGITLFTVAEGRYEPQNFPLFRIEDAEIAWDWTTDASNYRALRDEKTKATAGRGWEIESSVALEAGKFPVPAPSRFGGPGPTSGTYGYDTDGPKPVGELIAEDIAALHGGRTTGISRLTRMRADIARAALTEDLLLTASVDQGLLANRRVVTRELNEPTCTVWVGCEANGSAPRSEAIVRSNQHCATTGTLMPRDTWLAASLGFVALAVLRSRARRRA